MIKLGDKLKTRNEFHQMMLDELAKHGQLSGGTTLVAVISVMADVLHAQQNEFHNLILSIDRPWSGQTKPPGGGSAPRDIYKEWVDEVDQAMDKVNNHTHNSPTHGHTHKPYQTGRHSTHHKDTFPSQAQSFPRGDRKVGAPPSLGAPFETFSIEFSGGDWKMSKEGCSHDMKHYRGFTEEYRYCTKCDHKENV